jgi:hypothetical protein
VLLELGDEAGVVADWNGPRPARTRARRKRSPFLSLRQIAVDRAAVQAKPGGCRRDRRPIVDGCHHTFTQIDMIGAHAGLLPPTSFAPSQPLRKML